MQEGWLTNFMRLCVGNTVSRWQQTGVITAGRARGAGGEAHTLKAGALYLTKNSPGDSEETELKPIKELKVLTNKSETAGGRQG